jgi:hypothetical protein
MKIASITFEGTTDPRTNQPRAFATVRRPRGSETIEVTIDWPSGRSRKHLVAADDRYDQFSMAEGLQETLDGHKGTNSMVHDYLRELERFAD